MMNRGLEVRIPPGEVKAISRMDDANFGENQNRSACGPSAGLGDRNAPGMPMGEARTEIYH